MLDKQKLSQAIKGRFDYPFSFKGECEKVGVSKSTMYRAIGGQPINGESLFKILLWLNVPLMELEKD